MGYITQAPPPFPAFTLAHTAALTHIWHSRTPASLRWLRGAPLTRYGDHVSGLDHSEPVWFWAKEKPATSEGSGLWKCRWRMTTCNSQPSNRCDAVTEEAALSLSR